MSLFIAIVFFLPLMNQDAENTGFIMGRMWNRGEQKFDFTVTLDEGALTAIADSTGTYIFENLSPGFYNVYGRIGSSHGIDSIEVVAGDTTFADIASNSYDWWEEYIENYQYELLFRIHSDEDYSLDGFIIHGSTNPQNRLPSRRVECDMYAVRTPAGFSDFTWSLPWLAEQTIRVRDCSEIRRDVIDLYALPETDLPWQEEILLFEKYDFSEFPFSRADIEMNEWNDSRWVIEHTTVNPRNGNSIFTYLGTFIGFSNDREWLCTSVFKNKITTMSSDFHFMHHELLPPAMRAWCSPSGQHILVACKIFEDHGYGYNYSWFMINAFTGESIPFDPLPELEPSEEKSYLEQGGSDCNSPQAWIYISNEGDIIARYVHGELRTYSSDGTQNLEIELNSFENRKFDVAEDCETWVYMYEEDKTVLIVGNADSCVQIDIEDMVLDRSVSVEISPNGNLLAFTGRANGLSLYDLRTERLTQLFSRGRVGYKSMVFSQDESKIALTVMDNNTAYGIGWASQAIITCQVYSTSSLPGLLASYPSYSLVYTGSPLAVSNEGWVLMSLGERNDRHNYRIRVALLDNNGDLVWLGHYINTLTFFRQRVGTWGEFSSDGSRCFFSDSDQIHYLQIGNAEL